ncbi:hypothetical protein XENOCAPTIV_012674, partial [Xenoophorus captivus]
VRAWKHHHPGRVRRGGGRQPLLCTRSVAGSKHHELACQPSKQSKSDGRGNPAPLSWPVEQQRGWGQGQWERSAVGRSAPVLQPVGATQRGGRPCDWEPHRDQHPAARRFAERGVHV